jgi:hypothetical protein
VPGDVDQVSPVTFYRKCRIGLRMFEPKSRDSGAVMHRWMMAPATCIGIVILGLLALAFFRRPRP